ncbi:MAG: prephenate dehydrogenase/arogenate dehydrogenase family protein, partial [Candidatus Omnitrophica bacterium]|nr:prephenate dehydrogenase/arogenate dehydrogenase family protein [Candidatus Omnitrophota bacterium]
GSTKEKIVFVLEKNFSNFAGGHPLAGSEKRGIRNADARIFKNSLCILTPTRKTKKKVLDTLKKFWEKLGARTITLTPQTHDKVLSFTSHLPHLLAFSLMAAVPKKFLLYSGQALKDTRRIAASDPVLWSDIFLSNRDNILSSLKSFKESLSKLEEAIRKNDKNSLMAFLNDYRC